MGRDSHLPSLIPLKFRRCGGTAGKKRLSVVMIGHIVAVAMHRPIQVFFQPVGMAVILNHVQMILKGLKHSRSV